MSTAHARAKSSMILALMTSGSRRRSSYRFRIRSSGSSRDTASPRGSHLSSIYRDFVEALINSITYTYTRISMNINYSTQEENNALIALCFHFTFPRKEYSPSFRAVSNLSKSLKICHGSTEISVWGSIVTALDFFSHGDNHPGDKSGVRINRNTA